MNCDQSVTIPDQLPVLQPFPSAFDKLIVFIVHNFREAIQEVNISFYKKTGLMEAVLSPLGFV